MTYKLYDLLGVSQNSSVDEIKKAYRKKAMQHHPDKGGDETLFKEISNAYEVLSDNDKRNQYNQLGDENFQNAQAGGGGGGFPGGMNPHDLFAQMFGGGGFPGMPPGFQFNFGGGGSGGGGGGGGHRRGDHSHGIHINLNEAYHGSHKVIQVNLQKVCLSCKKTCHMCQGQGQVTNLIRNGFMTQIITQQCGNCGGTGKTIHKREDCKECKGRGEYNDEKRLEIDIVPGVHNGTQIRIDGFGEQKINPDDIPGDLILQIQINDHPVFTREGNNLKYCKIITFKESILGTKFTIDHFAGPIEVNTRDFGIIQLAKKYEITGKGMPIDSNKDKCGNLLLQFDIIYPSKHFNDTDISILEDALNAINL